ncbi:MAG: hypothetical protein KGQ52_13625 [Alphaproteobacteria bacterium]|nr:hypothetical protein [Alphaproteobacteria bacterium]
MKALIASWRWVIGFFALLPAYALFAQQPLTPELFQKRYQAELRQCAVIHEVAIRNGCIGNSHVAARPDVQQACMAEQDRRRASCEERARFALEGALENIRRRQR